LDLLAKEVRGKFRFGYRQCGALSPHHQASGAPVKQRLSLASAAFLEKGIMPAVKLHYEGWVSLPSGLRRKLGLNSGDRLEADLVHGTIVLRPATKASHPVPRDDLASDHPAADVPETPTPKASPARRKPGRPRKSEAADELAGPTPKRPRGRPKVVRAPQPEPAPVRAISSEPWKLRRKTDLQPQAASVEDAPLSGPRPYRARGEAGSPADERRPFRNVEVRKLGPGRRHGRPRGHSWSALTRPGK
jgi:bifunctional DNA-binding transcriptional regulator/antitoxin component of YhaV-PrlF toxin-antitoxin module